MNISVRRGFSAPRDPTGKLLFVKGKKKGGPTWPSVCVEIYLIDRLVGEHFFKSLFVVIITSNISVELLKNL